MTTTAADGWDAAPHAAAAWFGRFLDGSRDTVAIVPCLAELSQTAFIAADEPAHCELTRRLQDRAPGSRLVRQEHLPLALSRDLAVRRVVILDTSDEEAARTRIRRALSEAKFPASIIETIEFVTFFADVLPAIVARRGAGELHFAEPADLSETRLYAIVSTPRAGSTYLGDLLHSLGLGNPIEHLRPWGVDLLASRPPGLFDWIRFAQRLVAFGRSGRIFGTKVISHLAADAAGALGPGEHSYIRELAGRGTLVYLNRRNKLDQAISSLRAHKTGIWHSTDAAYRQADHYEAFAYDFDEIASTLQYYLALERRLAAALAQHRDLVVVDYDALIADPGAVCRCIAERLGAAARQPPAARVARLADAASRDLSRRFLAEAAERGVAVTQFLDAAELLRAARAAALDREAEAERIRRGHARSREGSYQDRHYHLIEYDCAPVPGLRDMWRGPVPRSLEPGGYVVFLGAAQTYGACVARPFPNQIRERLGVDVLNLAKGGVSPLFFAENPRMRELIAGARAVVVQAMAARMIPTSRFGSHGHMNLMYLEGDPQRQLVDAGVVWERVRTGEPPERVRALVEEARARWVDAMRAIAECAAGPTVLLWFSERQPAYELALDSLFGLFHRFPQLVDEASVTAARRHYTAYVEAVSPPSQGEEMRSAFSGAVLPVIFGGGRPEEQSLQTLNRYYPTQAMHDAAAAALAPVLEKLLAAMPP